MLSVRINRDAGTSSGGLEHTVRLRLALLGNPFILLFNSPLAPLLPTLLGPLLLLTLSLSLSSITCFAIMTRQVPTAQHLLMFLTSWGFPIHEQDEESRAQLQAMRERPCTVTSGHQSLQPARR